MAGVCMDGDFWLDAVPNLSEFYYTPWINTYGDDPRDEVNEFIDRFLPRAGAFAQQRQFGVVGYSQIQAYARAVEEAGTTDTAAVRAALENFEEEPLLIGPTTFDETFHGDPGRPFAVMKIQQGEHKYIETWKPQKPPIPDFIEQG
jgi:branched-chain amino acid transport system substrate-binding protein